MTTTKQAQEALLRIKNHSSLIPVPPEPIETITRALADAVRMEEICDNLAAALKRLWYTMERLLIAGTDAPWM